MRFATWVPVDSRGIGKSAVVLAVWVAWSSLTGGMQVHAQQSQPTGPASSAGSQSSF